MTIRAIQRKTAIALLCASSALLLQACGGGGSGEDGTGPVGMTPDTGGTPSTSGSVDAVFAKETTSSYQLIGPGSQSIGEPDTYFQAEANGAVTAIDERVLSGQISVQDIAGDANFALGRWAGGTLSTFSGAETLSNERSYHYVLFNAPADLSAEGSYSCDVGRFTTPTRSAGPSTAASTGAASGHASLRFAAGVATIEGAVMVAADGSSGSAPLQTSLDSPIGYNFTDGGVYLSGGVGAAVQIGDAGAGAYAVLGSYRVKPVNGASYIGVFRFVCRK